MRIVDNTAKVRGATEEQIKKALTAVGLACERYAKLNITKNKSVDTGNLRNSITHSVDKHSVTIGSAVEYAPYVELGTGVEYEGGRRTPWFYQDSKGVWHKTNGQKAKPYLRPAVEQHIEEYKEIIEDNLKK